MNERLIEILLSQSSFGWPGGLTIKGPLVLVVPSALAAMCGLVVSLIWAYKDANKRNKNGLLVMLMVLVVSWPLSLILWLWLRPPLPNHGMVEAQPRT